MNTRYRLARCSLQTFVVMVYIFTGPLKASLAISFFSSECLSFYSSEAAYYQSWPRTVCASVNGLDKGPRVQWPETGTRLHLNGQNLTLQRVWITRQPLEIRSIRLWGVPHVMYSYELTIGALSFYTPFCGIFRCIYIAVKLFYRNVANAWSGGNTEGMRNRRVSNLTFDFSRCRLGLSFSQHTHFLKIGV